MIEALRSVCRDVCGPAGTSAVVRSESGSGVTLTACGSRLLGAFAEHPVPGVVVQNTCAAQQAIYGEGGLTSTILACTLIRLTSELGARRRTDHLLLADTFQRCLGWCYECLESTSGGTPIFFRVPFRRGGDDEEAFAALARTVLFPKLLAVSDARAMDAIADALVRSFVADGDADEATKLDREGFVDGLRVLEVVGAPRECSRRAPGVFIARAPVMDFDFARLAGNEAGTRAAGGRVLIVAESMRLPSGPERTRRAAAAAEIARACETLGVRVVLCARAVDRHLQQLLARRGVLPLERVPAADLAAVAHATGARPLEQWATSATGECDSARAGAGAGGETGTRTSASYAAEWAPNVGAYEGVLPATLEGNPPVKYVKMRGSARALPRILTYFTGGFPSSVAGRTPSYAPTFGAHSAAYDAEVLVPVSPPAPAPARAESHSPVADVAHCSRGLAPVACATAARSAAGTRSNGKTPLLARSCCRCLSTARAHSTTRTPSVSQARAISAAAAARRVRSGPDGRRIDSATISTRPPAARVPASFPASRAKSKSITGALAMNTPGARREHSRGAPTTSKTRKPSTNPSRSSFVASSASPSATNDRTSASAMASIARASDTARSFGNSTVRASAANASSSSPPRRNGTRKKMGVPPDVDSKHS